MKIIQRDHSMYNLPHRFIISMRWFIVIYGKYKQSRDASWETLIEFGINSLPVMPLDICNRAGIKVYKNSDVKLLAEAQIGLSFYRDGSFRIIIDDSLILTRRRFTLAHELGHIFLGHLLVDTPHGRTFDTSKPEVERQADVFASRLLAPACVIWGINAQTAEQIATVCNISHEAATIRAERMEVLRKRGKFLTSPLERQVYKQFESYIENNRL